MFNSVRFIVNSFVVVSLCGADTLTVPFSIVKSTFFDEDMILAVYSDMQIDTCKFSGPYQNMNTMFENITKMFSDVGLSSKFKIPYKPPHILFWNLRKTNGFPALTSQKNVTYLSGYSSALLNIFCNKGIKGLQESSPQDTLKELLSNSRYDILEEIIVNAFS